MIALKRNKINVDKRGKISTGIKAVNDKGVEYPKAVDYFVIDEFPELLKAYGTKPTKLVLFFPSNEIEDFFQADMVLYGGNQTLIRKCNGNDECIHRVDEEIEFEDGFKKKFVAGEFSECVCKSMPKTIKKNGKEVNNPKLCRIAMYMKAFVADCKTGKIENPLCYLFYSGSRNTAENIYSELVKIRNLMGGKLMNIPFGLSVEMVAGKTMSKQKFPIWNLQVLGTMSQLRYAMDNFLFDYKEIMRIGTGENRQLPEGITKEEENKIIDETFNSIEEADIKENLFDEDGNEVKAPWDK